jgi:hypothetical protein
VEIAEDVAPPNELRQRAGSGGFQLAAVLAQLRRNPRVAEVSVELLLGLHRRDAAGLHLLHAILGNREATPDRVLAQRDVVVLRAGEVLEEVAVALRGHDT